MGKGGDTRIVGPQDGGAKEGCDGNGDAGDGYAGSDDDIERIAGSSK